MGSDYPHLRYMFDRQTYLAYCRAMKTLESSLKFETSDPAKFRLHVLEYYYKYGLRLTMEAFGVKKSTLYDWKREFEVHKGKLISLVPKSTRPHKTRKMGTDWRLVGFIRQMRIEHGNIGKEKIKPFLDAYATELNIPSVGLTTIGKIIKRRHLTFETRVKHKRKTRYSKLRTRKSPKVRIAGYVEMDSVTVYINKKKYLFMSVIDIYTKLALVARVNSLSSLNARIVFKRFHIFSFIPNHQRSMVWLSDSTEPFKRNVSTDLTRSTMI